MNKIWLTSQVIAWLKSKKHIPKHDKIGIEEIMPIENYVRNDFINRLVKDLEEGNKR